MTAMIFQRAASLSHPLLLYAGDFMSKKRSGQNFQAFCEYLANANLTVDAHLAVLAIEHGCVLYSTDSDFSRFPKLKWKNPLRMPK
jgi:hypothetical protein